MALEPRNVAELLFELQRVERKSIHVGDQVVFPNYKKKFKKNISMLNVNKDFCSSYELRRT